MSNPDLDPAAQARLRALGGEPEPRPAAPPAEPPAPVPTRKAALRAHLRDLARPVADPALDRLATLVAGRLRHTLRSEYDELAAAVELLRAEHASSVGGDTGSLADRVGAVEVNGELMKSEIAALRRTLEEFGTSIAPAAGLAGVPARFAELREQVNALDRRVRIDTTAAAAGAAATARPDATVPAAAGAGSGFDYVGFERRFRGDSATVLATLSDRYLELLRDHQPVLDFGCGRGELVEALVAAGVDARGVDPDAGMVAEGTTLGRPLVQGDGIEYLRGLPAGELGAIISVHVAEHLPLPVLVDLFEVAAARLAPGGVFIAETPNPTSLVVLGNSYVLDPTHVWPLHPSLMTFLAERAGFRDVELAFFAPAEDYRLDEVGAGPDAPPWVGDVNRAIRKLNDILFGPQEYALVARTPV